MPMKNPPHPGRSVRGNCLDPLGLSVTEAAEVLGVARHTLSRVLNGHAAISPDMAIRLEKAGWSSADFWLSRQTAYDLAQARKGEDRIRVERYQPLAHCIGFARHLARAQRGYCAHVRRAMNNTRFWDAFWVFAGSNRSTRFPRSVPVDRAVRRIACCVPRPAGRYTWSTNRTPNSR